MAHLCSTPARPRQTVIFTIKFTTDSLQCCSVEHMLICHMGFDPLWRLASVTNCPHATIELTSHIFNIWLVIGDFDLAEHTISKTKLLGKLVDDGVIRQ